MKPLRDGEIHLWRDASPLDVLALYCQRPVIHRTALGKPYVAGGNIEFSVSRSAGVAVIAVSRAPIGVDIERIEKLPDLDCLADCALAPAERRELAALEPSLRTAFFYRCWTRKEACLKALGTGLAIEPRTIDTTKDGPWHWRDPWAGSGFALAICARAPGLIAYRSGWRSSHSRSFTSYLASSSS